MGSPFQYCMDIHYLLSISFHSLFQYVMTVHNLLWTSNTCSVSFTCCTLQTLWVFIINSHSLNLVSIKHSISIAMRFNQKMYFIASNTIDDISDVISVV